MKLMFFRATWGMAETTLEMQLAKIRSGGFDGVEMGAPEDPVQRKELRRLLDAHALSLVTQIWTAGNTPAEHARSFEEQYRRAAELQPRWVNAHTGKDFFSMQENLSLVTLAESLERQVGVPIVHEVHRGRMTFSAPATEALLQAAPRLRLTADFSHWCCVHESLLADQPDRLELAIRHTNHIHARVGHPEGPQVNDPRAPEWTEAVETHLGWWRRILEHQRAQGAETLSITPEFGPPGYMPTLPFTRQPVADLWEVNVYMMQMLKEKLI
jgi:sugar phosphate isomerase/epimerase